MDYINGQNEIDLENHRRYKLSVAKTARDVLECKTNPGVDQWICGVLQREIEYYRSVPPNEKPYIKSYVPNAIEK